jgi:superfamily II DNA or RNA helicase
VLLASLAAARRDPLMSRLTGTAWDLVIADEAHRLGSIRSASGKSEVDTQDAELESAR